MPASRIVFILISLLIAGLGIFVFLRNPTNGINKRFCLFSHVISIWIFFVFLVLHTTDPILATFRLKLVFSAAIFIPSTFFFFSSIFPDRKERLIDRYLSISFFVISIFLAFSSSYIVESVSFDKGWPCTKYGPLFSVFWFYFIMCMAHSFYILYRKSVNYYGIKRLQIQYLYFGVAISVFFGSITNFLLPVLGVWQVEMFVPLVSIPIPIAVAYAIAKYHLMDISVVIKRSTVYLTLSIAMSAIYFIIGVFLSSILPASEHRNTITNVVSIIVTFIAFVSARESIQHVIEKIFFHTRYSHSKILSDSTTMFSSIHDLSGLLHYAIQYLYVSVGIEKICILLKEEETKNYRLKAAINFTPEDNLFLLSQDIIATWLYQNRTVLSRDQLYRFTHSELDRVLEEKLASLNVESCVPVFQKNDLFGIIFLGKKINKKIFIQEDIQMFLAFSGQLAMAANNARLYAGLKEAKVYRDNILQSLKTGVIVMDNNSNLTLINNEAKRILGLENAGTTEIILKYLGRDAREAIRYTLNNEGECHNFEVLVERENKKTPCGMTTTSLRTEDGEKLGALIILTDLTELKLLQSEKQHSERLAYLGTLAANIAHEIKNPLVAINTYFQLLPHKKNDEEFHNDFQKIAIKEIERINRIIEDLLDLAKPSKPVLQNIDPHGAIIDTVNFLRNIAAEKGIKIITAFEEKRCQLIVDEDKIKQVLINLLQNSLDALPENGHIRVSTSLTEGLSAFKKMAKIHLNSTFFSFASLSVHNRNDKLYFVIKVSDNGIGISAEKISQIFEPFFTDKDRGTGLGLAMVYRIIKDHEGAIYVESKEGIGTDFYISLPLNRMNINNTDNFVSETTEIHSA
ncbi:MAG: PAS domain-containing protein [Candidatus Jettenia sp.]|uniref:histidine kinase n=1 Tax=Candidatus Jettenia caeni TaxID=247490 RepID=I3IIJ8_9BACT|nr:ATP-binding protein [Candidatus Jettenia sp. AMX1]MBC6928221.1 PAS domain-containing protein [Candidatus Jettenia sp.]GAB61543.1 two-component sensor kinase [Candidatus Jettenia caeni]MCE7880498.1 PAS domain-containing protein [Candidatus Jettenia sp. AMX1]MCQ3926306.1 PAS domain-containing protein [Candidatus Jettenia sp.]MDL1938742.1 PAS domain-containing protein [Candidatus Jettenia sp. AMX1]